MHQLQLNLLFNNQVYFLKNQSKEKVYCKYISSKIYFLFYIIFFFTYALLAFRDKIPTTHKNQEKHIRCDANLKLRN